MISRVCAITKKILSAGVSLTNLSSPQRQADIPFFFLHLSTRNGAIRNLDWGSAKYVKVRGTTDEPDSEEGI